MTPKIYSFDHCPDRTHTHSVKWDLREKFFGYEDVTPMWVADMDFETPDFIIQKLQERLSHPILGYSFRPESFFKSFMSWAARKYEWDVQREWVDFSPGVVPAVTMVVETFTEPGDEIIVQPPVYFPFFTSINGTNRKLVYNPLKLQNGRLSMDLEHLESVITERTRMIIISNPHNPGGSVWTPEELKQLGAICHRRQIRVLSDEIHSDLVFTPHKHTPFAKVVPVSEVSSITCMAASKSFNLAGLSTSVIIIPEKDVREKYQHRMHVAHVGMGNIFGTVATETAYREGWDWMQQLLNYLQNNRDWLFDFFSNHLPEVRMVLPEATYLAWVDFSGLGKEPGQLHDWLLKEAGLAFNPGTQFGPGGEGYMRINFACPRATLEQAIRKLYEKATS